MSLPELVPPGAYLRLFRFWDKSGWSKYRSAKELSQLTGLSLRVVYRMLSRLERLGLVEVRYDLDTHAKLYKPAFKSIRFTDGYVVYEYVSGLIWDLSVEFPRELPSGRGRSGKQSLSR